MITSEDLSKVPLFEAVDERDRARLALRAADIYLEPGQWLVREGEEPRFFVVLEGELEVSKEIIGQQRILGRSVAGDIRGEMSVLMGTSSTVSLRALTTCRAARFERQQLQELVRDSPSAAEIVFKTIASRTAMARELVQTTPSSRVRVSSSRFDGSCRGVRSFLSANRIPYEWHLAEPGQDLETDLHVAVENIPLEDPSIRGVAQALGFQTRPKHSSYDLVIAGAGPAGMAAAVYSGSEGLRVLVIEKFCVGGQAGTSSRIENYLGFPAGISGDDLSERALKQAERFGVELLVTRTVAKIESFGSEHCLMLDGAETVRARSFLLTTGVSWNRLAFANHDRFLGRGISYGTTRFDGETVAGHCICIIGGGNSAGQAAVYYAGYASEVRLLVRGPGLAQSMSQYLIRQIAEKANIRVETYTQVIEAHGGDHLERITTRECRPGQAEMLTIRDVRSVFIMTGAVAKTEWLPSAVERDANGYVLTGRDLSAWPLDRKPFALETSVPGLFCAGDVRHGSIKRVASAVGEGSMSISYIHEYLALPVG